MIDALHSVNATGLECYEVNVTLDEEQIDGYLGVRIVGRRGALDEGRSGIKRRGNCIVGYNGIYMREADWDGTDVFLIPGIGINIFLTERATSALEPLKPKGVELIPNEECRMG